MSVKTRAIRLAGVLFACIMLALSAGFAWSVADDYSLRETVPAGVTVSGVDIGGLTREQARVIVEQEIAAPLLEPVEVVYEDKSFTLDPADSLSIDVDTMLEEAFGPKTGATVAERIYREVGAVPVPVDIEPKLSVAGETLDAWVTGVAAQIDTPPVDATFDIVDGEIYRGASATGLRTIQNIAVARVTETILGGTKRAALPVEVVEPDVSEDDLGKTIVVDLSERHLYLYDGMALEKDYGVAIGTPDHPTPRGSWKLVQKRYMPTWRNPGSAWAKDMPDSIPPGPSNPLGTRALNLDASGIRIHGTTATGSIGRAASHGCMRMRRGDIEDLYPRVDVGTPVLIVR